jgi:hypothetical protein
MVRLRAGRAMEAPVVTIGGFNSSLDSLIGKAVVSNQPSVVS